MAFPMLLLTAFLTLGGMRRVTMLRHLGQFRAARSLYGRWALGLAGAALFAMGGQLVLLARHGQLNVQTALPLHLCSLMGVLLYPALRAGSRRLWHIALFLAVPGGLGALLFPAVRTDMQPQLMAFFFFLLHCILVVAPFLPLALGWRPRPLGAAQAYGFLAMLACVVLALNRLMHTNYLFLNAPAKGTPLAFLGGGTWPGYLCALAALAAAVLALEGLAAWRLTRRWPESFPLPLDWREDFGRGRHMG